VFQEIALSFFIGKEKGKHRRHANDNADEPKKPENV
jgi:hypothetical protein